MRGDEMQRVHGMDGVQHHRILHNVVDADRAECEEPYHADGAEQFAHGGSAVALKREQRDQHDHRERDDVRLQHGGTDCQPLDGGDDRDRRREHRFTIEQRRADHSKQHDRSRPVRYLAPGCGRGEREQRHDAAFALVVGAHDQCDVLERDDDHQRPEDGREAAQDRRGIERDAVFGIERFLDRIQRACADVAIDDAEREQRQRSGGGPLPVCVVCL
jgi:hypothetical protein